MVLLDMVKEYTATISTNGDLISRAYLELESNDTDLVPYFGLRKIKRC